MNPQYGPEDWSEGNPWSQKVTPLFPTHPNAPSTHPNASSTHPQRTLNAPPLLDSEDIRVLFSLADLLEVAGIVRQVWEKSWRPALERVAPEQIKVGKGKYTRTAMELCVSLRQARNDGLGIEDWVAERLAQQERQSCMDAAIANAEAAGAIVPTEVITLGSEAAQTLALAQSQASLASSFASAVLGRIHDQQLANSAQFASIEDQAVAAQAALQWARRQQIQAQTFAALDAQAQAIQQGAIAAQLQQFQGGRDGG
jgi:hypothetical protein